MGIRELRDNLTTTIRQVRAGEAIEITHDGVPVALLTPLPKGKLARLVATGMVTLPKRPLRLPERLPTTGPMTASEALEEDRNAR